MGGSKEFPILAAPSAVLASQHLYSPCIDRHLYALIPPKWSLSSSAAVQIQEAEEKNQVI